MGEEISKPVGSKSYTGLLLQDDIIDYKDSRFTDMTKLELYNLFMEDKIVHIDKLHDIEDKLEEVEKTNTKLKNIINKLLDERANNK